MQLPSLYSIGLPKIPRSPISRPLDRGLYTLHKVVSAVGIKPPPVSFGRSFETADSAKSDAAQSFEDEDDFPEEWLCGSDSVGYHYDGQASLLMTDRARHMLLSWRLRRPYFLYCFACFMLAGVVCTSTARGLVQLSAEGKTLVHHRWETWEIVLEVLIGSAMGMETLCTFWLVGRCEFLRDVWCLFDATVVVLTLLTWALINLRNALLAQDVAEVDLPLIALRSLMQPCRVLAAASMIRRVRKMQLGNVEVAFEALDDLQADLAALSTGLTSVSKILNPLLWGELRGSLPAWCRFSEWRLAYSPRVHGVSLQTFYRSQTSAPYIIVVRDACGNVFGGFVTESWHSYMQTKGSAECFVFTTASCRINAEPNEPADSGSHVHIYRGAPLLWSNAEMLALGSSLIIRANFLKGSTSACPVFDSPKLTDSEEFVIRDFECWQVFSGGERGWSVD